MNDRFSLYVKFEAIDYDQDCQKQIALVEPQILEPQEQAKVIRNKCLNLSGVDNGRTITIDLEDKEEYNYRKGKGGLKSFLDMVVAPDRLYCELEYPCGLADRNGNPIVFQVHKYYMINFIPDGLGDLTILSKGDPVVENATIITANQIGPDGNGVYVHAP